MSMERVSERGFAAEVRLHRITCSLLLWREKVGRTNGAGLQWFKSCSFFHRILSKCSINKFFQDGRCCLLGLKTNAPNTCYFWKHQSPFHALEYYHLTLKMTACISRTMETMRNRFLLHKTGGKTLKSFSNCRSKVHTVEDWKPLTEQNSIP